MKTAPRTPADSRAKSSRRPPFPAAAGLAVAAVLVYANSFGGPFIFDDFLSIPRNPTLPSLLASLAPPGGGVTVTGRPVLNFSFALNHALSGNQVWSYHALNLLIHLLAGLALYGVVRRTLERPGSPADDAAPVAFLTALLWTVHPLQTEAVTYIVQRAESLMGLFYLLTLYCFIRGAEAENDRRWLAASLVSCLLGMGTKEVMVSAPVVVFLYDRTFLAGSFRAAWRARGRIHLALAATWLPLAGLVLHAGGRGGSAGFGSGVGAGAYVATQFQAVAHYLRLVIWPHPLILDYGVQWVQTAGEAVPAAAGVGLLVGATLVALVRRPRLGFPGFCFCAILAPTSLVPVNRQTLAEHRMYLALAPVMVLAVLAAWRGLGRRRGPVLVAAAVVLGVLTVRRNLDYRSSEAIWSDTVARRPGNAAAHNNYGNLLAEAGRAEDALAQYDAALRIDPDDPNTVFNQAKVLRQLGRLPEAIARYEQLLRLRPGDREARYQLGLTLLAAERIPEAITRLGEVIRDRPDFAPGRRDLGRALGAAGRLAEAVTQLETATRLDPEAADARNDLGLVLMMSGRPDEGIAQFEAAVRLDPGLARAHLNLALALADAGRSHEAEVHFAAARRLGLSGPAAGF